MAQLVREAYASGLDTTFVVAAGLGLVAGIAVFLFVRPRRIEPVRAPEPTSVDSGRAAELSVLDKG